MKNKDTIYIPKHFKLEEILCPHSYKKYVEKVGWNKECWAFIDERLLINLDWIREQIGSPIIINNYNISGPFSQRGLRCNLCEISKSKTANGLLYLSAHCTGQAVDFHIPQLSSPEVRTWLKQNQNELPFPIRLEHLSKGKEINWVHIDTRNSSNQKIYMFNT